MKNEILDGLYKLMAEHGFPGREGDFTPFIELYVKPKKLIITIEFKNDHPLFDLKGLDDIKITGEIDRVQWDFNAILETEHILQAKADFDKYHRKIDSQWLVMPEAGIYAYFSRNRPRRIKQRGQAEHRQGGKFVNDTHFRKTNNSRRGY